VDREYLDGLRDEVLRVRQRQRRRMEDVGVEEVRDGREISAQDAEELFTVPRERPHHEERVAQVPRHVFRQPGRERPRASQGDRCIRGGRAPRAAHQLFVASGNASSIRTWRIAAVGTARIAPTMPRSEPPMSSETITTTALTPTWRSITFGTRIWFSNCCCATKKTVTPSATAGDTEKATMMAGIAARRGPTTGIISPIAAMSAST